jgi:hypothetical protein
MLVAGCGGPLWCLNQFEQGLPSGGQLVRFFGRREWVRDSLGQSLVVGGLRIKAVRRKVARCIAE